MTQSEEFDPSEPFCHLLFLQFSVSSLRFILTEPHFSLSSLQFNPQNLWKVCRLSTCFSPASPASPLLSSQVFLAALTYHTLLQHSALFQRHLLQLLLQCADLELGDGPVPLPEILTAVHALHDCTTKQNSCVIALKCKHLKVLRETFICS